MTAKRKHTDNRVSRVEHERIVRSQERAYHYTLALAVVEAIVLILTAWMWPR